MEWWWDVTFADTSHVPTVAPHAALWWKPKWIHVTTRQGWIHRFDWADRGMLKWGEGLTASTSRTQTVLLDSFGPACVAFAAEHLSTSAAQVPTKPNIILHQTGSELHKEIKQHSKTEKEKVNNQLQKKRKKHSYRETTWQCLFVFLVFFSF